MKPVLVIWVDSGGAENIWEPADDYTTEYAVVTSVGYLLVNDKDKVVICQSDGDIQVGGVFVIPKVAVKSISDLFEGADKTSPPDPVNEMLSRNNQKIGARARK
jgi:hypothetical protein